jgi:hypothetical protein
MSALCQKQTYALQQNRVLLDHLVGERQQIDGGGLGRTLSVYRLPEADWMRRLALAHDAYLLDRIGALFCCAAECPLLAQSAPEAEPSQGLRASPPAGAAAAFCVGESPENSDLLHRKEPSTPGTTPG